MRCLVNPNSVCILLLKIGMPMHLLGAKYFSQAVILVLERPARLQKVLKCIYGALADRNNTKPANIERAMRHTLKVSWGENMTKILNEITCSTIFLPQNRPSNSEFIAIIVNLLRKNC